MTALPHDSGDTVAPFYEFLLRPVPEPEPAVAAVADVIEVPAPQPRISDRILRALQAFRELEPAVDRARVTAVLEAIIPAVSRLCPDGEQLDTTSLLGTTPAAAASVAAALAPSANPQPGRAESVPPASPLEHRFALALSHLESMADGHVDHDAARAIAEAELVILATSIATDRETLRDLLARVPLRSGRTLFQSLGGAIPSWDVPEDERRAMPRAAAAMRRIILLAGDANERARRIRELVMAGVTRMKEGAVFAAVTMFELAGDILDQQPIHDTVIERIRTDALRQLQDGLTEELLRDRARHALLRRAFAFFPPLREEALLDELHETPSAGRKQLLMSLIEVWGAPVRRAILARIERQLEDEESASRQQIHDLLELLERIPRAREGESGGSELEVLSRASAPGQPSTLVEHAVQVIASLRSHQAERLLSRRLSELEAIPFRSDRTYYEPEEVHALLDATIGALATIATPTALRAVVRHCLGRTPQLGDVRSRLHHLAGLDLSSDAETLQTLLNTVREELPVKILGRSIKVRQNLNPSPVINALRSTTSEEARALLRDVAASFPHLEFGLAAANLLQSQVRRAADASARETRNGSLTTFDLPRLLLSLLYGRSTGQLSLVDDRNEIRARLWFLAGEVVRCETGRLAGEAALLHLIERPVTGSWVFTEKTLADRSASQSHIDVLRLIEEGIRRHDDLRACAALVPDTAAFAPGSRRPGKSDVESDPQLLRTVWVHASASRPVGAWEASVETDSWRVRRIVARWVEEGALVRVPSGASGDDVTAPSPSSGSGRS